MEGVECVQSWCKQELYATWETAIRYSPRPWQTQTAAQADSTPCSGLCWTCRVTSPGRHQQPVAEWEGFVRAGPGRFPLLLRRPAPLSEHRRHQLMEKGRGRAQLSAPLVDISFKQTATGWWPHTATPWSSDGNVPNSRASGGDPESLLCGKTGAWCADTHRCPGSGQWLSRVGERPGRGVPGRLEMRGLGRRQVDAPWAARGV